MKPGTAHPKIKIPMSPAEAVRLKCEQANISRMIGPCRKNQKHLTVYEGHGPMMAYHFCQTQKHKKLGQGSGALMAPGVFRKDSDTLIFAVPPITVTHNTETWTMTVDFYLCIFNGEGNEQTGRVTLPPKSNTLYGTQNVEDLFEGADCATHLGGDASSSLPAQPELQGHPGIGLRHVVRGGTRGGGGGIEREGGEGGEGGGEVSGVGVEELASVRTDGPLPRDGGAAGRLYEVVWSGKWSNTWEPATCLEGWESEMEDAALDMESTE